MKLKLINKNIFYFLVLFLLGACDPWADDTKLEEGTRGENLFTLIRSDSNLSTFASILVKTGYDELLSKNGGFTVFAPTNGAFGSSIDMDDLETLREIVANHISYLSHYTNAEGVFEIDRLKMANEKNIHINRSSVDGSELVTTNITGSNGVLHVVGSVIMPRKNIWEYLQEYPDFIQVQIMTAFNDSVMDEDRSVYKGVEDGLVQYDTVWKANNEFLNLYPLNDENESYVYILVRNAGLEAQKTLYAKYMLVKSAEEQEYIVNYELTKDLIFSGTSFNENSVQHINLEDVRVTAGVSAGNSYEASNGMVYIVDEISIKMYENKIKPLQIEAEENFGNTNYFICTQDPWSMRIRSWASGGYDVMLNGITRNTLDYINEDGEEDTKNFSYYYTNANGTFNRTANAGIWFYPTMYAVDYEIFWVAHDDIESHYEGFTDTLQYPMVLEQKLFLSFPEEPALQRVDGVMVNNFDHASTFAGVSSAGPAPETVTLTQLHRYATTDQIDNDEVYGSYHLLDSIFTTEADEFGDVTTLKCPYYGSASMFVAASPRHRDGDFAGMMFLDYVLLRPIVDEND